MELSTIVQHYLQSFRQSYGPRISTQIHQAIGAVLDCHTQRYGAMQLHCNPCEVDHIRFHSCGHRSCPRCQNVDTTTWLQRQSQKLLPVDYFMVTFTLPRQLRSLAWHHQQTLYSILFECAVSTLKDFGINDKKLGAQLGMTGVLHTHTRCLDYHPHLHLIIPGGCIHKKRQQWRKLRGKYLFNETALAKVFRGRFLAALAETKLIIPEKVPIQWIAHCKYVGKGLPALQYLSRYLYRGVISQKNIIDDDGTFVTFRYLDSQTNTVKTRKVKGEEFLWLVFQHVLPKGFRRVRDFGFLHGNAKKTLGLIQALLVVWIPIPSHKARPTHSCPGCGRPMFIVAFIPPAWRAG